MDKQGFIYMWTNTATGTKYIGSHYGTLSDGYVSSSNYFNEQHSANPELFTREILYCDLDRETALINEQKLLVEIDAANCENYYNLHNYSGKGWSHHDNPDLAKIYYSRISAARKGQPSPHKGKSLWGEHNRHKLRIDTWEIVTPSGDIIVRENMLEFCKEHDLNPSAMSAVARGIRRIHKGYTCKKLTNNRNVQYEYTEWKSKGHSSKARYGKDNGFARSIVIDGIEYDSMREASAATGLSMYKLRKLKGYKNE